MITDSHCHLTYLENPELAIKQAYNAGVTTILSVGTSFEDFDANEKIADSYQNVWISCGIHPEYAEIDFNEDKLKKYLKHPRIVAVGEIGLDYFYKKETRKEQIKMFERQLCIAEEKNLPVIIHTREADDDCIAILSQFKNKINGVLHCFSGSRKLCEFGLEINFYISASGIITFKNAQDLRDIFKNVPENRLLVETDAPYLAPHPLRGKKNEPSFIIHTLSCLANIKNISLTKMEKITSDNFFNLFGRIKQCR